MLIKRLRTLLVCSLITCIATIETNAYDIDIITLPNFEDGVAVVLEQVEKQI